MGFGIWSMHYLGMEAFRLPLPVQYDWPTVLLSILLAVAASAVALFFVSQDAMGLSAKIVGSLLTGGGIAPSRLLPFPSFLPLPSRSLRSCWPSPCGRQASLSAGEKPVAPC
jgi:hypothetical protein